MNTRFPTGQYYGVASFERQLHGLHLKHLEATVPEHDVHEHSHTGAHLVLATRGTYLSTAQGEPREGPVLVYNPADIVHRDRFKGSGGWFFAMSLSSSASLDLYAQLQLPDFAIRSQTKESLQLAFSLMRLAASPDTISLDIECVSLKLLATFASHRALPNAPPSWLLQVKEMIADRSDDDLNINELAQAVGVHRVYLTRQYLHHFSCTPGDDLRRRRIERATHFLMNSRHTMIEIAHRCGYCDQSHFHRSFVRHYGISPNAFRKLC